LKKEMQFLLKRLGDDQQKVFEYKCSSF